MKREISSKQTFFLKIILKRFLKFAGLFIVALSIISFLPLFIQRTMIRSQVIGNGGDVIKYELNIRSLYDFLSDSTFSRLEENFVFYLVVNIVLAFLYSFVIAFFLSWTIDFFRRNNK